MSRKYSVVVKGLGKKYLIQANRDKSAQTETSLLDRLRFGANQTFWALQDVSFKLESGKVLGIIGKNGSGKTTLLKILSRITEPSTGEAKLYGKVSSLLSVGTGFNPELSGRENVFVNGAILGMSRREVKNKFDEIVDFSGVEEFIDVPVKRYSSGMSVRLGFAVAAFLDPDLLIIDEVLAVGDAEFRKRSLGKMNHLAKSGRTVLFVSHNMGAISGLCDITLHLNSGKVVDIGDTSKVIANYLNKSKKSSFEDLTNVTDRNGEGRVKISGLEMFDNKNKKVKVATSGSTIKLELSYQSEKMDKLIKPEFGIQVVNTFGQKMTILHSRIAENKFSSLAPNGKVTCMVEKLPLMPGSYKLIVGVSENKKLQDEIEVPGMIEVVGGEFFENGLPGKDPAFQGVYFNQDWKS